jgi:HAD superfamily hydrolase (TIGR01484 family)
MLPRTIAELSPETCAALQVVLTDIDGTMTDPEGRIPSRSLAALEAAQASGLRTVVVTGRPAGWCDMIARTWPVDGVVGENGGLAFWRDGEQMQRAFLVDADVRSANRAKLEAIRAQALRTVPGCGIASDQPYRELDLAVDFCEDVPSLDDAAIDAIVELFERAGAHAKVSNIHVNGWFGDYDKLGMCKRMVRQWFGLDLDAAPKSCVFLGDSPNDEPMFAHFPNAVGVANVRRYLPRMTSPPAFVTEASHATGFAEALDRVVAFR